MNNPKSPDQLAADLLQFTGTDEYFRYWYGLALITEGVKYLADQSGCYWLLDAIASYQSQLNNHPDERLHTLQFWTLKVNADKSAVLICLADSGETPAVAQKIEWTDFPLPEIQIWVAGEGTAKTALLPSEY